MSQLRLTSNQWGTKKLNVLSFSSPITGMISSAQTRTLVHHFPIKALQPELEVEVVFRNEPEYESFQLWVRNVQIEAQNDAISPGITLWWPQRSIYNWTGIIKAFRAGGRRADYMPKAKFTIDLIDSMVSSRTTLSSLASNIQELWTEDVVQGSMADILINPPAPIDTAPIPETPTVTEPTPIMPSVPWDGGYGGGGQGGGAGGGGSW